MIVLFTATSWVGSLWAQEPVSPEARTRFEAGVTYLRGKSADRFERAYREFKAAYAHSPTWKILGNLGIVAQQLERYGEAIDAFEQYLERGGTELSAEEVEQVRRDLELLHSQGATLTLKVADGPFWVTVTRKSADGAPVVNDYGPFHGRARIHVRMGEHEIRVEQPGSAAATWSVTLEPGDSASNVFELGAAHPAQRDKITELAYHRQSDERAPPSHTGTYVLWGGAAVTGVATAIFFRRSAQVQADSNAAFLRACPHGAIEGDPLCGRTTDGDASAANWRTAALVSGVASASALIAGVASYWITERAAGARRNGHQNSGNPGRIRAWFDAGSVRIAGTF